MTDRNLKYSVDEDGDYVFENPILNQFMDFMEEHDYCDDVGLLDMDEASMDEFLKAHATKVYFLYDGGSNESDYPVQWDSFNEKEAISAWLDEQDIYNYESIRIFNFETGETHTVKRQYEVV